MLDRREVGAPPARARKTRWLARASAAAVSIWLIVAGLGFAWSTAVTIHTSAWPEPTMDQFRLYRAYLELPFPDNVLQRENGHRPVLPGLLRVAELRWAQADQSWQIGAGATFAFLTAALIALVALRERSLPWPARAAALAAASMAVLWLGNARMLIHGNELVHAYLLTLSALVAAWAAWRAGFGAPWRWMALAAFAAAAATFCFGPGIALFPALLIVAWLQRVPLRTWSLPLAVCTICLVLYLFVLPGDQAVRGSLQLDPAASLQIAARWLASPWINAWLGFAEPPLNPIHAQLLAAPDQFPWLGESANALQRATGLSWSVGLAATIGAFGFTALALCLILAAPRSRALTLLEAVALLLMLFGAACAAIIAIGRFDYLQQQPTQIFADRYLVWPCLFWLGLGLRLLAAAASRPGIGAAMVVVIAALPLLLWPTQRVNAGWAAATYWNNATFGAAIRSDVYDRELLWPEDPSVALDDKLRALQLFRERGLAMFADADSRRLGQPWHGETRRDDRIAFELAAARVVTDLRDGRAAWRFTGGFTAGCDLVAPRRTLIVVDPGMRVVGYATRTHVRVPQTPLPWMPPCLDGVDGYVARPLPGVHYRVLLLDDDGAGAIELGGVPAPR